MILAGQDGNLPRILLHEGVGPMSAHVVMSPDLPLAILYKEKREASFSYPDELSWIAKSGLVRDQNPLLGKDGSPLELIHGRGGVP